MYIYLNLAVHCRGGVGNFQVQAHTGPALDKMDELFNNDKILAFKTPKGDLAPKTGRKGTSGMSLPAQKALAWAAVHLLIFLEKECQQMARQVIAFKSDTDFSNHLNPSIQIHPSKSNHPVCVKTSTLSQCLYLSSK